MMKKLLICMLLIAAPAFAFDGNKLNEYMLDSEAVARGDSDSLGKGYTAGIADGYVIGVGEASEGSVWCSREGVTIKQAKLVVAKFLRENPQSLDTQASLLVRVALAIAFPCPKK